MLSGGEDDCRVLPNHDSSACRVFLAHRPGTVLNPNPNPNFLHAHLLIHGTAWNQQASRDPKATQLERKVNVCSH